MKMKLFALVLAAVLIVSAAACAKTWQLEEADWDHDMNIELSDEYTFSTELSNDLSITEIARADQTGPGFTLLIAYYDPFCEKNFNDLDEDDRQYIFDSVTEEMSGEAAREIKTLPSGLEVMIVREKGDSPMADIVTVFDGFFLEMYIDYPANDASAPTFVTAQDIEQGMQLYSALNIYPVSAD